MQRPHLIRVGVAIVVAVVAILAGLLATGGDSVPQQGEKNHAEAGVKDRGSTRASHRDEPAGGQRANPAPRRRGDPSRMPTLIGLSASKSIKVVERLGRRINYGSNCRGRKPRGHVIDQFPEPGGRLFPNGNAVEVSFDHTWVCSRDSAQSACDPRQLKFDMFARRDLGDGEPAGEMLVGVHVMNRGPRPCQLTATAEIELHRRPDAGVSVLGSPHEVDFDYRLNPGNEILGGAWWANWCGSRDGSWRVEAHVGQYHGQARLQPPDCQHAQDDSVLG